MGWGSLLLPPGQTFASAILCKRHHVLNRCYLALGASHWWDLPATHLPDHRAKHVPPLLQILAPNTEAVPGTFGEGEGITQKLQVVHLRDSRPLELVLWPLDCKETSHPGMGGVSARAGRASVLGGEINEPLRVQPKRQRNHLISVVQAGER